MEEGRVLGDRAALRPGSGAKLPAPRPLRPRPRAPTASRWMNPEPIPLGGAPDPSAPVLLTCLSPRQGGARRNRTKPRRKERCVSKTCGDSCAPAPECPRAPGRRFTPHLRRGRLGSGSRLSRPNSYFFSLLSVSDFLDLCSLVLRISVSTLQALQGRLQCMTVYSQKLPPAQL